MDFSFAIQDLNILTFLMAFVVFGVWQFAKIIAKKDFDAKTITGLNTCIAVLYAVLITAFGVTINFWDLLKDVLVVMAGGSIYDVLKAYNVLK